MAVIIEIGDVDKTSSCLLNQLSINDELNSRSTYGFGVKSEDGTYRPVIGEKAIIRRDDNLGATWNLIQRLGTETRVCSLVSLGGGIALAGTGNTGQIYKSIDSGATWNLIQRLGTETRVYSL
ncbi:MAG: hypothetical protein WC454_09375, partial [Phycisphaerae bacterium]